MINEFYMYKFIIITPVNKVNKCYNTLKTGSSNSFFRRE